MKKIFRLAVMTGVVVFSITGSAAIAHADTDPTVPSANGVSTTTPEGTAITFLLQGISNNGGAITFATSTSPSNGSLGAIGLDGSLTYTPTSGFVGGDSFTYVATEGATSSSPAAATITVSAPPRADTATITIRDGATTISDVVNLPSADAANVSIAPTSGNPAVAVSSRSVLALLETMDAATTTFDITDLQYFSSFNSFLINCISIPAATSTPLCSDWQYVVDGVAPAVGVDQTVLGNGSSTILYFGFPRQVALSDSSVVAGTPLTATAQTYDPANNTFSPATGVTIGVMQPDPNNPFSPLEIATSTVDSNGQATFTLNATGTYAVGIKEDFYFPTTALSITDATTTTGSSVAQAPPAPTTGGGGGIAHAQLNVQAALSYLSGKQHADGSFDSPLLADWATFAFAASDPGNAKTGLRNYLLTASPVLSNTTDYERHAMALEALGINPYSGTAINYIAPIVSASDGTQIGDPSLDNDDIFALFPLTHAGYGTSDDIIQKTVAFIVARQEANGSWDGSVDVTAAAIQALAPLGSLNGVSAAIVKAEQYLHAQQQANGGWSNSFSTSWVLQAIAALNEPVSNWAPIGYNPNDYLASLQQFDGGVEPTSSDMQTRVWATEYAVLASLGKAWNALLQSFSKPVAGGTSGGGGHALGATTSDSTSSPQATSTAATATSTPSAATSTPEAATSTPLVETSAPVSITATSVVPVPEKIVIKKTPLTPSQLVATSSPSTLPISQTAAAGGAGGSFFGKVWQAIVSFFARIF
jgi:hypothetical protein